MRKWNKLLALLLAMVMAFGTMSTALAEGEEAAADAEAPTAEAGTPAVGTEAPAAETGAYDGAIVILHTNDVHGAIAGYAKVAALAAQYEAEGAYVLIMDAGDFSQGEAEVSVSEGATAVELMDMAGYDVVTLGNHEFDYGYAKLLENLKEADFQVTAANVTYEGASAFDNYVVFEAPDGTKVGVFGLSTPETATKAHPAKIKGVKFAAGEDMYAVAQAQVDALTAAECDVIVTLAHLGIDEESTGNRSIDLLEHVTGIDVLIDGHSHSTEEDVAAATNAERKVGETVVTSTGTKLESIGVITIKDGVITTSTVAAETITVAEDDAIVARAAGIAAEIEADYGTVFATTEVKLSGDRAPGVRTQETPLGNLIADAILWYATKDGELPVPAENVIALTNGGGIRATIEAGDITKKDINTVLPFGNTVAYITITGEALLEALEASTYAAPDALGGFPQVSGINFTVNTMKKYDAGDLYEGSTYSKPNSINRVTIDSVNGNAFDPAATYVVVTNDFTAAGGDTYYAFSVATVVDTGVPMDEAVMAYITEVLGGVVTAEKYGETAGRITIKGYSDVSAQNWFCDAVAYATEKGLIDGLTETTFGPSENMTRAGLVTALYRLAGSPEVTAENVFSDVADDAAYKNAVIWANANGVVTGKTATTFDPDGSILRQEIAALLYRYVSGQGYDVSIGEETNILSYTDALTISEYAIPAIQWMCGVGLFQGNADGSIQPKATATRSQVATILMRFDALELTPAGEAAAAGTTEAAHAISVSKYGNVTTDVPTAAFAAAGFEVGDILTITVGETKIDAPYGTGYSNVDTGSPIILADADTNTIAVAINMGNFAETYGVTVGETVISFAMGEKAGYLEEYEIRNIDALRTNVRADYASDEVFANFRAVELGNLGEGVLYRSSSPVNPELGRNTYADTLIENAGVKTVINLADSEEEMKAYEGYADTYYATLHVVALDMGVDFSAEDFAAKLKTGLEYMIANEGPYLIHCTEGKDRAGFVSTLLAALMGADLDELVDDYMKSYENYYHVEYHSDRWTRIAQSNVIANLITLAGVENEAALDGADLQAAASAYLTGVVGLTAEQVTALQSNLAGAAAEVEAAA